MLAGRYTYRLGSSTAAHAARRLVDAGQRRAHARLARHAGQRPVVGDWQDDFKQAARQFR